MIFDGNLNIADEATRRWRDREAIRAERKGKTTVEIESPQRLQAGLERLAKAASGVAMAKPNPNAAPSPGALRRMGLERVIGQNDFQQIAFLELALAVARFVGRIQIRSSATRNEGSGTGFMVSPRLLLTNNHVLPNATWARFSEVVFDYQNDRFGRPLPFVHFQLRPDLFFMTDVALDFSLVAVAETSLNSAPLRHYGWSRLIAAQGKILLGDHLNIIQHPKGQFKQFVSRSNQLVDVLDTFLHYVTDTEPGSSGSPVYNDRWEVVALHHSGIAAMRGDDYLDKNDNIWNGRDPEDINWVANEGIRVSSLVSHIEKQPLSKEEAALRDELLNLEPLNPIEAAQMARDETENKPTPKSVLKPDTVPTADVARTHVFDITLPLRVTVEIGTLQPDSPEPAKAQSQLSGRQDAALEPPARPEETVAALAELERAPSRTYYDAQKDEQALNAYYDNLHPDDLEPEEFFDELSNLLARSHRTLLRYAPSKHLYPWVDLRDNDPPAIISIYSGEEFNAYDLIEADARIEAERVRAAEAMLLEASGLDRERALDMLEAAMPFNCEHVVPQSWFGKREPMRGDLHHLFACEVRCNSFRSNTPYFDFPDFAEAVRDNCGKSEAEGFEPTAGKGAVARATLYFLLRYPGEINSRLYEYREDRLDILLDWHTRYPVDDYERHRNAAIAEKQGNRNPTIDHPAWVDRIDFARGLALRERVRLNEPGQGENPVNGQGQFRTGSTAQARAKARQKLEKRGGRDG